MAKKETLQHSMQNIHKQRIFPLYAKLRSELLHYTSVFTKKYGKVYSLDVGTRTLKIALVRLSQRRPIILRYAIRELKPHQSSNDVAVLREFIDGFAGTEAALDKDIVISFHDPDAVTIRRIELPSVPEKEMVEAIRWEIKSDLPFEIDRAYFDWQIIGEYTDKDGAKRHDLIVACVKTEVIDRYVRLVRDAGFTVIDIKLPPFNISCVLERLQASKHSSVPVLDFGAVNSYFCLYKNGMLGFVRSLPFSVEHLAAHMTGTLTSTTGKLELTQEKVETIKREVGIPHDPGSVLPDGITGSQILALMRPVLERLCSEITRSIDYCVQNLGSEVPQFLYITGGGSQLKGMGEYLRSELRFNVDALPLPNEIGVGRNIDRERFDQEKAQLISPIGAALGADKRPSLLPPEYKIERLEALEKISLRLVSITVGILFLFSLVGVRAQVVDYRNRLKNAKLHLQTLGAITELYGRTNQRMMLAERIQSRLIPGDWILKEISGLIPEKALLNIFILDQVKDTVILNGYVITKEEQGLDELTAFTKALEASPFFTEATLRFSERTPYKGKDASRFEIHCTLAQ